MANLKTETKSFDYITNLPVPVKVKSDNPQASSISNDDDTRPTTCELVEELLGALQSEAHPWNAQQNRPAIDTMLANISQAVKTRANTQTHIYINRYDIGHARNRYELKIAHTQRKQHLTRIKLEMKRALQHLEAVEEAEDQPASVMDAMARKRMASEAFCGQVDVIEKLSKRLKPFCSEKGPEYGHGQESVVEKEDKHEHQHEHEHEHEQEDEHHYEDEHHSENEEDLHEHEHEHEHENEPDLIDGIKQEDYERFFFA
ncbi:hypothetical protein A1O3_07373 [Capronia epimyces CBS 606.96]|uniref:Uncharacterized protein n=1 Tax=Capronia epimyces CBS 606.96 TaxID=1182542 RepID=W9XUR4_9EURO|nr:uncharacterized protein A1O3_07373 [Capronia epimyces CBS 606.96]EXJ81085.1 hypothetical protein A1O3_07373 [Capronia epimyces CBS 606.96]